MDRRDINITEKLTAALRFEPPTMQSNASQFYIDAGKYAESKRLAPLHLALIECVKALDEIANVRCAWQLSQKTSNEALEKLAEVLK